MGNKLLIDPIHNLVMNFENQLVTPEDLIKQLYQIGVFQTGVNDAPIAIDFRKVFAYPTIMNRVADFLWDKMTHCNFQHVLGVPLAGAVLANAISMKRGTPLIVEYQGELAGDYFAGQSAILVGAFIATGKRLMEVVHMAKNEGLQVTDAVVFLDSCLEGVLELEKMGVRVHSVLSIFDVLPVITTRSDRALFDRE